MEKTISHRFGAWFTALLLTLAGQLQLMAQEAVTLDSVLTMALRNNRELAQSRLEEEKAAWQHEAARTNYLPRIDATAGYMRTGRELSLLSDKQKQTLNNLGTSAAQNIGAAFAGVGQQYPDLLPLLQSIGAALPGLEQGLNGLGQSLTEALHTDTRNMTAGALILTQPIYMGGKIRAYDQITSLQKDISREGSRAKEHEVELAATQTYWQVVSLAASLRLARQYEEMMAHLDSDISRMVAEGVATRSDALSVNVKLGEARLTVMKVEDGLALSKMLLCHLCGLDLHTPLTLTDEAQLDPAPLAAQPDGSAEEAFAARPELAQLAGAEALFAAKVRLERSAFLPQVALTGGVAVSNPNVFNSFERKFKGTWGVGVMVKVPVWHWNEGRYKVRAARTDAALASLRLEEARGKVALQVEQETFRVKDGDRRRAQALRNVERADENLRMAQVGFAEGVTSTSDLLQAQTAWVQAQTEEISAKIETRLTRSAYGKALGRSLCEGR